MSFLEILRMVCACPEYSEIPVRHNEDKVNMELSEELPIPLDPSQQSYDSPHTKTFLLLQAHLFRRELPSADYKTDLKSVLDRTIPIIQANVDIAAEEAQWRTCLNLISLLQCLHQACHPWQSTLMSIPYLNIPGILEHLRRKESVEHLPQLVENRNLRETLGRAFEAQR